ncbi:MAG: N-acetylmuramoyl-L-alanine amidase [Bacteriovorax sp.]|nr:N-acetylmuramoyl-L-alanine amidase [Bacteriovorax sp.]
MKYFLTFCITCFFSISSSYALTILIDPGHGGEDDGAKAMTLGKVPQELIKEKDIALLISQKIYNLLSAKNYTVFLTRSFDRTVSLPERAAIAEKTKADLFISVHINSSPESSAVGFETYYLDNHNDVAIKKVEKTENIPMKGDEVVVQQILVDLVVEQTVSTSKPLAQTIHSEIKNSVGRKYGIQSRGIKPGLFFVLALSKRPGVLLEVGFISTQKERVRMMNPKFQDDYASAVARGIEIFFKNQKGHKSKVKIKKRH